MIVGFNVDSIEASRGQAAQGNLQIHYNPKVKSVESAQVKSFDEEVARIEFDFEVQYEAGGEVGASIKLSGNILWNGDTDKVVKSWEEDEQLPDDVRAPLMNDLYRKCLSQSVGIADTLNLIPPIPTPQVDN